MREERGAVVDDEAALGGATDRELTQR